MIATFRRVVPAALPLLLAAGSAMAAGPPAKDPDWPCVQRLVPEIAAQSVWSGPALPTTDWHADPTIASLVDAITPRAVAVEAGEAKLDAFAAALAPAERAIKLPEAFAGIVAATNQERGAIIARIKDLARRQRGLADMVVNATAELAAMPAEPAGAEAGKRDELAQRRAYLMRQFQETQRTMRYACEVPVQLEARLGRYAKALQSKL